MTSSIVRQVVSMTTDDKEIMKIGDVTSFRDWSHVEDIVNGYILLAERGEPGSVYVQGSMRANSVLTYILKTISSLGYRLKVCLPTNANQKVIRDPLMESEIQLGNFRLRTNKVDELLLGGDLKYSINDVGLVIQTDKREFKAIFDEARYRPSDVPILLSNINKIKEIGFNVKKELNDIIECQINYYLDPVNRINVL